MAEQTLSPIKSKQALQNQPNRIQEMCSSKQLREIADVLVKVPIFGSVAAPFAGLIGAYELGKQLRKSVENREGKHEHSQASSVVKSHNGESKPLVK